MDESFFKTTQGTREPARNESVEISLEERKIVERIEKLKTSDFTKAMIMLVWKGLRKSAEFDFADYNTEHEAGRSEQAAEAEKLFDDLGILNHRIQEERDCTRYDREGNATPGKYYRDRYYIARHQDDLNYIVEYFGNEETFEIMKGMGKALGYPDTAIDAWDAAKKDGDDTILPEDYTKEPYNQDEMAFTQFRLSKANWQEEFKVVKGWADEVRRLAPSVYERIVKNYRFFHVNWEDNREAWNSLHH